MLKLITAPTTYPVTLADAKLHCRVDASDEDTLLAALVTAATEMAEQKTGRALMTQTWELTLDAFPAAIELTRVPVQTITSIKYRDADGVLQTLSGATYVLAQDDFGFAKIAPTYGAEWPSTQVRDDAVVVEYVAGYASAAAVPESIKQWIKLMISTMYDNRDSQSTSQMMPWVHSLLDRYRIWVVV